MASIRLLYIATIVLFAGCSLQGDRTEFTEAFAVPMCGPADGPALRIIVPADNLACDRLPQRTVGPTPGSSYLVVWIDGILEPETPSILHIGADADENPAQVESISAEFCRQGHECAQVISGTVRFEEDAQSGNVSMSLQMLFEDGSEIETTARIHRCDLMELCP